MLTTILGILLALVVVFVLVLATKPNDFRVARSIIINAPPSAVFMVVNDPHRWNEWSPWAKFDPQTKCSYEGPATGVGATFKWDGNGKVGAGIMTITDSKPNDLIRERLEFLRPFKGVNTVEFTFKTEGAQTNMTWAMFGKNTVMSKIVSLFMDCNKMVGNSFDEGLGNLKAVVERGPQ